MNVEELEKLNDLRKRGIITEAEFNNQKNKLLNKKKQSTFLWLAFLGSLGIHNFYVGQTIRGIVKIILWVLYLALGTVFPILAQILSIGIFIWIIVEMCITKKTASGVNLIPASTACKVTIGVIIGICIILTLIGFIASLAGYTTALQ